jgi:ubiquinone/menaquinone biosynthesis C-methylase UbiE
MKHLLTTLILWSVFNISNFAQKPLKPFKCGYPTKDTTELKRFYKSNLSLIEVKNGERIASVGAMNGYQEVQIAIMRDSIDWTLQDIDTNCLNQTEFNKVFNYYEKMKGSPIIGKFSLLVGDETKTNLSENSYDRVLLINVYHELTDKTAILNDIHRALKKNGRLVIMEAVAKKKGQKRRDCHHIRPWEPDFLKELEALHFKFIDRKRQNEKALLSFYTFESI